MLLVLLATLLACTPPTPDGPDRAEVATPPTVATGSPSVAVWDTPLQGQVSLFEGDDLVVAPLSADTALAWGVMSPHQAVTVSMERLGDTVELEPFVVSRGFTDPYRWGEEDRI